jgi:hypothetical protein
MSHTPGSYMNGVFYGTLERLMLELPKCVPVHGKKQEGMPMHCHDMAPEHRAASVAQGLPAFASTRGRKPLMAHGPNDRCPKSFVGLKSGTPCFRLAKLHYAWKTQSSTPCGTAGVVYQAQERAAREGAGGCARVPVMATQPLIDVLFACVSIRGCVGCSLYLIAGFQLVGKMFTAESDTQDSFISLLSSLLTAAFAVSLLFFSGFHLHLVLSGQSTIEASLRKREQRQRGMASSSDGLDLESGGSLDVSVPVVSASSRFAPSTFDAGSRRANWDAVFGSNPWLWFFPIDTLVETGYEFDFLLQEDEEAPLAGGEREQSLLASNNSDRRSSNSHSHEDSISHSQRAGAGDRDPDENEREQSQSVASLAPPSASKSPRARAMELERTPEEIFLAHQQQKKLQQNQSLEQMAAAVEDASMNAIVQELSHA